MKAITIHQPYASLWASGLKKHETRGWSTSHRGLVAVHAGKTREGTLDDDWCRSQGLDWLCPLDYGAIVGVVRLVNCKWTRGGQERPPWVRELDQFELSVGDFGPDRYGWEATDARLLTTPIPMRGQQGIFDLTPEIEALVREQLKGGAADE